MNIYILYIRSVLESSAEVWNSSLTEAAEILIERDQKTALKIILADKYENYPAALIVTGLQACERQTILCKSLLKIASRIKTS